MNIEEERAVSAKAYLEAKGYEFQGMNATGNGYVLAFLAKQNGTDYIATLLLSGNAVMVTVLIESYDVEDFSSEDEASQSIPVLKEAWMACASTVNPKMDGLCSIVVKSDSATSMSAVGMTKGYYSEDTRVNDYIYRLFNQALVNTDAGAVISRSLFEELVEQGAE